MKRVATAVLCVVGLFTTPSWAHGDAVNESPRVYVNGEVQKLNAKKQTITLKHEPVKNLRMEAGTTEFPVRNEDMLKQVKPGDKVVFSARNVGGTVSIRTLAPAPGKEAAAAPARDRQTDEAHKH